jgi:hypothetical protein
VGVVVIAFNGSTNTGITGVTNANGQAALNLQAGSYRFRTLSLKNLPLLIPGENKSLKFLEKALTYIRQCRIIILWSSSRPPYSPSMSIPT